MVSKSGTRKNKQKLALCIPCHAEDLSQIDTCFKSIKSQTKKPDILCMSVSSSSPDLEKTLKDAKQKYGLPIHFIFTESLVLPGGNRNRAAEKALTLGATHLTFFDFDDIMHPKRIESISKAFKENPQMVGFLHGFRYGVKKTDTDATKILSEPLKNTVYFNKLYPKRATNKEGIELDSFEVKQSFANKNAHNEFIQPGHSSIKAPFWKKNPFDESLRTGEDCAFITQVLLQGKPLGLNPDPLTLYLR
jgi:hypothetical protein